MLSDSSEDWLDLIAERIDSQKDMTVVGRARNGILALEMARSLQPTVLMTDILLPGLDGVAMLRRLNCLGLMPKTIVATAFINSAILSELEDLGVASCYLKPFPVEEALKQIRENVWQVPPCRSRAQTWDSEIGEVLRRFGIAAKHRGYLYLREAIGLCLQDGSLLKSITKVLYPTLAKRFYTTPECVERSMRNAVEAAWKRPELAKDRDSYFGGLTAELKAKPSNREFLTLMTGFIQSHMGGRFRAC